MYLQRNIAQSVGLNFIVSQNGMEKKNKINYKVFIPYGITFLGTGTVFMATVNPAIGITFIAVGGTWIAIGAANEKGKNSAE